MVGLGDPELLGRRLDRQLRGAGAGQVVERAGQLPGRELQSRAVGGAEQRFGVAQQILPARRRRAPGRVGGEVRLGIGVVQRVQTVGDALHPLRRRRAGGVLECLQAVIAAAQGGVGGQRVDPAGGLELGHPLVDLGAVGGRVPVHLQQHPGGAGTGVQAVVGEDAVDLGAQRVQGCVGGGRAAGIAGAQLLGQQRAAGRVAAEAGVVEQIEEIVGANPGGAQVAIARPRGQIRELPGGAGGDGDGQGGGRWRGRRAAAARAGGSGGGHRCEEERAQGRAVHVGQHVTFLTRVTGSPSV